MTRILLLAFVFAIGEALNSGELGKVFERNLHKAPSSKSIRSAGLIDPDSRWDGNTIVYNIDKSFRHHTNFFKAINHIKGRTCIRFKQRLHEPDYINVTQDGNRCHSESGKIGGQQILSLGTKCNPLGIQLHELMHVIGFHHEQCRYDRDEFITVNEENIQKGGEFNFERLNGSVVSSFGVPYDYNSILHYGRNLRSINKSETITPLVPDVTIVKVKEMTSLSPYDIKKVNSMYCPSTQGMRIQNVGNQKYLTIKTTKFTLKPVETSHWTNGDNQKFTVDWYALQDPAKGAYLVPWMQDSKYVEILSAVKGTGYVFDWLDTNTINQLWWVDRVKHAKDSRWQIKNKDSGKCISKGTFQAVMTYCNKTDLNQLWKMYTV